MTEEQEKWYERETAAFRAWWEAYGEKTYSETPTMAAGAGWLKRAESVAQGVYATNDKRKFEAVNLSAPSATRRNCTCESQAAEPDDNCPVHGAGLPDKNEPCTWPVGDCQCSPSIESLDLKHAQSAELWVESPDQFLDGWDGEDLPPTFHAYAIRLYKAYKAVSERSAIGATASPDGPVYLVNGKPCRRCTCPKLEGKCPLGVKRTDATTELSFCLIPVNDVLLVGGR